MMLQYLYFCVSEALTNLWRSRVLNLLAIGVIMFAMFILGSFLFVGTNLKTIALEWQDQIQFNIFLHDDISVEQLDGVEQKLKDGFFVDHWEYVSKTGAKDRFLVSFPAYAEMVATEPENPFPASFKVQLLKGAKSETLATITEDLKGMPGIESIYYDEEIFQRLGFIANLIQMVGLFFGAIMIGASVFTISNVLKLTFFARREEVDIMKLVGASRTYIRGPFILEAILQGLMGALFGILLIYFGHLMLTTYLHNNPESFLSGLELKFLPLRWCLLLVVSGGLSGLLGSLFSLNQFLEEHISYQ